MNQGLLLNAYLNSFVLAIAYKDCRSLSLKLILIPAARTKNYSGAELEGVVKSAVSFALNRQISLDDLTKTLDEESIKLTMDDFLRGLHEVTPAFGASTDDLERCRFIFSHSFFYLFPDD